MLAFRLCEIATRVTSLALFQRACRPYGGITVVFLDFLVMAVLTRIHGGNLAFAIPSVFSFMNPMLERSNAVTLPCRLYFTVRLAELATIAGVAVWWRGKAIVSLYDDDHEIVMASIVGLVGMAFLLPCVRSLSKDSLFKISPQSLQTISPRKIFKV